MQHATPKPAAKLAGLTAIEAQEDALDRLLNDADSPFDPARVWQLLDELTQAAKATQASS